MTLKAPNKSRTASNKVKSDLKTTVNKSYIKNHVSYDSKIDDLFLNYGVYKNDDFDNHMLTLSSTMFQKMSEAKHKSQYRQYKKFETEPDQKLLNDVKNCNFDENTTQFIISYIITEKEKQKKEAIILSQQKATKSRISQLLKFKSPLKNIASKAKKIISNTKTALSSILWWALLLTTVAATSGDQSNQSVLQEDTSHSTVKTTLNLQEQPADYTALPEIQTPVKTLNREPVPVLKSLIEVSENVGEVPEITPKNKYQMLLDDIQPSEGLWKSAERAKKLFWMEKSNRIDLQKLLKFALSEGAETERTMTKEFQAKTLIKYLIINKQIKY